MKDDRDGKVFVDSTRVGGATVVAAYSPRVRPGVPVSFPVAWDDLDDVTPADFTVHTALEQLGDADPWAERDAGAAALPADLIAEGHAIPVARVQAMHEGKRRARARRTTADRWLARRGRRVPPSDPPVAQRTRDGRRCPLRPTRSQAPARKRSSSSSCATVRRSRSRSRDATARFVLRMGPTTFAIFDAFPDDDVLAVALERQDRRRHYDKKADGTSSRPLRRSTRST